MTTVVILLGAPGAGKGTQAVRLSSALELPHVSTGDLFRANLKQGTELGERAKSFMNSGKLVPDELVLEMLFDRVGNADCTEGYLLDGFPRTLPQAEALDARLEADAAKVLALEIEVPDERVVARISGRRVCRDCGNIHHVTFSPPRAEGVCDACGGELYQREDDNESVVAERLAAYHRETLPLVDHYGGQGLLTKVDGDRKPDEVFEALLDALPETWAEAAKARLADDRLAGNRGGAGS